MFGQPLGAGTFGWADALYILMGIIVTLIGYWCHSQDTKIAQVDTDMKEAAAKCASCQLSAAQTYVTKTELGELIREVKDSLVRIENKIEKFRDQQQVQ